MWWRCSGPATLLLLLGCAPGEQVEPAAAAKVALEEPAFAHRYPFYDLSLNDGPFWGARFDGDPLALRADQELPFRDGRLVLCNRSEEETPVLYRQGADGKVLWVVDLDPAMDPEHRTDTIRSIELGRLSMTGDVETLGLFADWSYGYEYGYAYFGPDGEFGCFWLSW